MGLDENSYFRTTELGEWALASGVMKQVTVKSPALGARGDASVYVPQQVDGSEDVPVVILLHGVYGSHWVWSLKGEAHLTLQAMIDAEEMPPCILAMPSDGLWCDGSAYKRHGEQDFEKWIVEDVPRLVSEVTGNGLDAPHFIGGLSMGGYGAMRLGAKHHERFRAFSGHSSITDLEQMPLFVEEGLERYRDDPEFVEGVFETIEGNRENVRPFRFDCGVDDLLIEHNRTLNSRLKEAGIEFQYEEFPGGHEWPYWVEHVAKSFRFFRDQL